MSTAESYGAFAYAYDQALGERYFRAVRRLLADVLDRYPSESKTHLDVCCGTALAMPFFAIRGFVSTGVDISPVMLNVARKRAKRLVAGDVRALPLRTDVLRGSPVSTTRSIICSIGAISSPRSAKSRASWTATRSSSST